MRRRNILHLIETSGPGGAENVLINLASHLSPERYRSMVCLLKDGWLATELRRRGLETFIIPQQGMLDWRWLARLVRLLRVQHVDVMHAHEFAMNTYGTLAGLLARIPVVTTVHGKNYYTERLRRRQAYRLVARHSTMVAVSEEIGRFLRDRVGVPPGRVTTIYNGIDTGRFPETARDGSAKVTLGLPSGALTVGAIGNLYPVKGHADLLRAVSAIRHQLPNLHCLIAGRGELLPELQRLAAELRIPDRIHFLGFRPDIPALLQAMDVFALPSLSEGLPLSLLEAMAAGRPVVATRVGGVPEVVHDGVHGYLVPPQEPQVLADRLLRILRDPAHAAHLGRMGRERVRDAFDVRTMARRYEVVYEAIHAAGADSSPSPARASAAR